MILDAAGVHHAATDLVAWWGTTVGRDELQLAAVVASLAWAALTPWRLAGRRPSVLGRDRTPVRRRRAGHPRAAPRVELAVLLDLVGAALSAGAGVPRALEATGRALAGPDGLALGSVAAALLLGAPWETAWANAPDRFSPLASALRPAWVHGSAPREALRVAGLQISQDADSRARAEAARLGVRLVLPLGLCFLPAFVLIGLVPLLLSLGAGVLGH
ncbi:Type II secretion system (T2SS), protein F [Sanguibacter gelidistatuariae]|uniref:Type II secretion system (T2SS), protein F n=1 Tax=Sanguibacter gelidistatuariae TaxID=1814289 RepID=A0A1G6HKA2_9MICO|nr:type II secretion system F family protein [Sanguibacter gelidistatuariae]SDB94682.1 Type II secretion system (T2SS), protein F [Sanguibacter gelidistatuariae]